MAVDDNMLAYNAIDSAVTLMIANQIMPELEKRNYKKLYDFTIRLLGPLVYMQTRGIKLNREYLTQGSVKLKADKERILKELHEIVGFQLNPLSHPQVKNYFYITKNIPPYTKKGTGSSSVITCDDKALTRIARGTSQRKGLREAKLIQEYREANKLSSSYFDLSFDKDDRIRCSWNPRGTRFGRLSSSKTIFETGMNLQNLPMIFKEALIPDEGYVMIEMDKRQAEWVVVAYTSGDANMIKVIEEGGDPHTHTAAEMFKVPPEVIKEEAKIVGHETNPAEVARLRRTIPFFDDFDGWVPRTMSMRQCGKKSNHGLNYDETYRMFSLINEITEAEAKVIVDYYHKIYPGIKRWHEHIQKKLAEDRTLTNCFGRKYEFLDKWGPDLFKAAYSFEPQSTVVDMINDGMIKTYENTEPFMREVELLAQVHDSILFQMPVDNIRNMAMALVRVNQYLTPKIEISGREFVIHTDAKIGRNDQVPWAKLEDVKLSFDVDEQEKILKEFFDGGQSS